MESTTRTLPVRKNIALVAHDHCKQSLMKWVERHQPVLAAHQLYATGTTGNLIQRATGLEVNAMLSGPMGGDQQVGALVASVLGLRDGALHDLILAGITVGVEHGSDLLGNERGSSSASTASQNNLLHR